MLVEALWDRGVQAHGLDVSEFAIAQVRPDMRAYCRVGSIIEPFEGGYDLVTCIEVLEHMPAEDALHALKNLCKATSRIIFSSTPNDFAEKSHINVHPTIYWLNAFSNEGFYPNIKFDASFIAPHAILLERNNLETLPRSDELRGFAEVVRLRIALANSGQRIAKMEMHIRDAEQTIAELKGVRATEDGRNDDEQTRLLKTIEQLNRLVEQSQSTVMLESQEVSRLHDHISRLVHLLNSAQTDLQLGKDRLEQAMQHGANLGEQIQELEARCDSLTSSLSAEVETWQSKAVDFEHRFREIESSSFWRVTAPMRRIADRIPKVKKVVRVGKGRAGTAPQQFVTEGPAESHSYSNLENDWESVLRRRFMVLEPMKVRQVNRASRRVTLITDSLNQQSLFGGVATAIIFATLMAERMNADLRVVTRLEESEPGNVDKILRANNLTWSRNIEFIYAPPGDLRSVEVGDSDVFVTTSWWTTYATRRCVEARQIVYLVQEDERMFYPMGDDHLLCSEVLNDPSIMFAVNSQLLADHFVRDGMIGIETNGMWFEPSFPEGQYFFSGDDRRRQGRKNFMFYARPNNLRNLYYRGVQVIGKAIEKGVLSPDEWNILFVGKDLSNIDFPEKVNPRLVQGLNWKDYGALVRSVDLGLCLMYTPHPSYPPLDIAACGGVAVTNRFGEEKYDLSRYSDNIIVEDLAPERLVEGIDEGVRLAANTDQRTQNYEDSRLIRDWESSMDQCLNFVIGRL